MVIQLSEESTCVLPHDLFSGLPANTKTRQSKLNTYTKALDTLEPLTGELNNFDYSAVFNWVLTLMWMLHGALS